MRNAAALDRMKQLKEVYRTRRDPALLYYIASAFDRVKKTTEALEYYRRVATSNNLNIRLQEEVISITPSDGKYLVPDKAVMTSAMDFGLCEFDDKAGVFIFTPAGASGLFST